MMMKRTMTINFVRTLLLLLPYATVKMDTEPRIEQNMGGGDCSMLSPDESRYELRVGVVLTPRDRNRGSHLAYQVSASLLNRQRDNMYRWRPSSSTSPSNMTSLLPCIRLFPINVDSPSPASSSPSGSFGLSRSLCRHLESPPPSSAVGLHAVLGPRSRPLSAHVRSVCAALDVPHLSPYPDTSSSPPPSSSFSLTTHPLLSELHSALSAFLRRCNRTRVAIVFQEEDDDNDDFTSDFSSSFLPSVGRAQTAILLQDRLLADGIDCVAAHLQMQGRASDRHSASPVLLELKKRDLDTFLLELAPRRLAEFFRLCRSAGLQGQGVAFFMANLEYSGESLSGMGGEDALKAFGFFRLLDPEHPVATELRRGLRREGRNRHHDREVGTAKHWQGEGALLLETALAHDTLLVLAKTIGSLGTGGGWNRWSSAPPFLNVGNASCSLERSWEYGATFFNYLNAARVEGVTGNIVFKNGHRVGLELELMKFDPRESTTRKVGQWTSRVDTLTTKPNSRQTGTLLLLNGTTLEEQDDEVVTLTVVTKEERPYVMLRAGMEGNDAYDGFAIDLLKAISDVAGFRFKLYTVPDNLYGVRNEDTGEWNGIVRQLIDKRADLAVASMTINYARETVIDFTKPFMNLGISILFKAPKDPATELFSFMNPLEHEIWLCILLAYVLVSLTIWIVARFSPYEWAHPHPCVDAGQRLIFQNDFTLPNAFWFAIGTLMQQGSDLNPKAMSTRIVGGMWWFFTLIMISSYTANLAAFLTVERMATPIESAEDLADQNDIAYGTLVGGSTLTFFRDAKMETYQKMWRYMESNEAKSFVNSYEEGVQRVLNGDYAFLCESTMLDYLIQRNCNLTQIGGLLDDKGYGIATPKGSKWKDRISQAILFLHEKGSIQMMYNKWWKNHGHLHLQAQTCGTKKTLDQRAMANVNALGIVNIGGIFVVLLCGLAVAVIVAICEFCLSSRLARTPERQERERGGGEAHDEDKGSRLGQQARTMLFQHSSGKTSLCSELTTSLSSGAALVCGCASGCRSGTGRRRTGDNVLDGSGGRLGRADCSSCSLIREHANL